MPKRARLVSGRGWAPADLLTSTRAKLFALIALALAPMVVFKAEDLRAARDQRIEATKERALDLARDAAERHAALIAQASAVLEVVAEIRPIRYAETEACTVVLRRVKERNAWAGGFGLIDLRGRPVCSDNPAFRDVDLSDREYFRGALRQDHVFVSGFLVARTTRRPNVVLARAVRDADGVASGVLIATVDFAWLRQFVADVSRNERGLTILLDRSGTVLARHPDEAGLVGRNILHAPSVAALLARDEGVIEGVGADGVLRLAAVTTIAASGEKLVVAFEKAAILAAAEAEFDRNLRGLALLVLGAAILAWLGGEVLFLRWIRRLRDRAERLGRGEFDERAALPGLAGELAVVGRALDAAAESLGERERSLRSAEEAARQAEAASRQVNRYLLIAEGMAHVGYWRVELPTRRQTWSPEIFRIHGLEPAAEAPDVETSIAAYHPDDRQRVDEHVARAIAEGCGFEFQLRLVRPSGEVRTVRSRGSVERDDLGAVAAIFGVFFDVTEAAQAEAGRLANAARLEATLEAMDQGLIMVGADGRIEVCNTRAMTLLDLPRDLMASGPTAGAVLDHQRAAGEFDGLGAETEAMLRPVGAASGPQSYERTRPNGTVLEVRSRSMASGGLVRTYTDVSDRKRAEKALRGQNDRFDLALAHMNQGLCFFDADKRLIVANLRYAQMYGLAVGQVGPGTPLSDIVAARDAAGSGPTMPRPQYLNWRDAVAHRSDATDTEVELQDGRTIAIHHQPLPGGGWVATHEDVTARRRDERAMRESEERFRQLAETTSDVITRMSLDFVRDYVSPACRRLLGYEPEELMGEKPAAIMHPDDAKDVYRATRRIVSGEAEGGTVTYRARHKDGRWIWVEGGLRLVRDEATGEPSALLTSLRDITGRKETELALAEAKRAAEAASAAKTDFLASMSHEIRTPLNGVIGYADFLLDDAGLDREHRRQVERIQGAGHALLTVVNDILDFSKIEAGEVELEPRPFLPHALVENAASIVRAVAESKGLALVVHLDPSMPERLVGDEDRLRQVLLNLLNNAIKFTPAGSVTLRAAWRGDGVAHFEVQDTGIGIPGGKAHRLFQRFSQVDGSIRREFGGTGLGLAISKQLVEMMGGEIGVESAPGRGSTFRFTAALTVAPCEHQEAGPAASPVAGRAGARLLLVEDVLMNQEIGRAVLERAGYVVDVASDGAAAIMAVQSGGYDLVLMDVQMPGMDGVTATDRIRSLDHPAASVPIIAMTANVLPHQVARFRAAGMDDHVGKPFKRQELLAVIDRHLSPEGDAGSNPVSNGCRPVLDVGALDAKTFDDIVSLCGREGALNLLAQLAKELRNSIDQGPGSDRERWRPEAHALASSTGMLGFLGLSRLCSELEEACASQHDVEVFAARFEDARRGALKEIGRLTAA